MQTTKKYIQKLIEAEVDAEWADRDAFIARAPERKAARAQYQAEEKALKEKLIAEIADLMRKRMQNSEVEGVLMTLQEDYPAWVGAS